MQFPNLKVPASGSIATPRDPIERFLHLFRRKSVVAVFGSGDVATRACEGLAAELFVRGRRVVIVSVVKLLQMNPIVHPKLSGVALAKTRNFWIWPPNHADLLEMTISGPEADWLSSLSSGFDAVLLDCPELQRSAGCASIAGMAQAAVLAVELGKTSREEILRAQRTTQSIGLRLEGSIIVNERQLP